jgi:hypothetical protein
MANFKIYTEVLKTNKNADPTQVETLKARPKTIV